MNKLPITVLTIVRNSGPLLKPFIEYHKEFAAEVVVVDQDSDDGTWEVAKQYADYAVKRRNKGRCEPDRNFATQLGTQPWVLYLDDDEKLSPDSIKALEAVLKVDADAVWIFERTFINGFDVSEMDGRDPHVRLFKRGVVQYHDRIHALPGCAEGAIAYYPDSLEIHHHKTFAKVMANHERRKQFIEPHSVEIEENYIKALRGLLERNGVAFA